MLVLTSCFGALPSRLTARISLSNRERDCCIARTSCQRRFLSLVGLSERVLTWVLLRRVSLGIRSLALRLPSSRLRPMTLLTNYPCHVILISICHHDRVSEGPTSSFAAFLKGFPLLDCSLAISVSESSRWNSFPVDEPLSGHDKP
jgi:hypothetical protein